MAEVMRTCPSCGNVQASGEFCENCGSKLPGPSGAATPPPAPGTAAYGAQPQSPPQAGAYGAAAGGVPYGAPQMPGAPVYGYPGYAVPRTGWSRIFDFSFQGFVTAGTLKTLYIINLALIGLYVLFNIILAAIQSDWASDGVLVVNFFISLFVAAFWFFLSRIIFELMATVMRIREDQRRQ